MAVTRHHSSIQSSGKAGLVLLVVAGLVIAGAVLAVMGSPNETTVRQDISKELNLDVANY